MAGPTGRSHKGKDDEQLYNWASWLFSSRTVPLFASSSPHFFPSFFFFLLASPKFTSPLISVWQRYWMRELRDTYMCRGESQWTATHHDNLQVFNQFWVSQSVNFMNENNPRCYSEIQYFVFSLFWDAKSSTPLLYSNKSYIIAQMPSVEAK